MALQQGTVFALMFCQFRHGTQQAAILLLSLQVPNFTKLGWVSAVGAVASLTYSTLAYALAFKAGKQPTASYAPIDHGDTATAVFGAFNAIANIGASANKQQSLVCAF